MKINQIEPFFSGSEIESLKDYFATGGWLTEHHKTQQFEEEISRYIQCQHTSIVPSGTVGIYLALLALNIGPGDQVAVPNYTMIASINAISWTGATPVIIDVVSENLCINMDLLEDLDLKALVYVSINGRSGDLEKVAQYCSDKKIHLIEDAAQAMGSKFKDRFIGTFGQIGVFSFTPHKIITTGQGGAIITNDISLHEKIQSLKDFGRVSKGVDIHKELGFNFKFTDLQSIVGIEQLRTINKRIELKKTMFQSYMNYLSEVTEIEVLKTNLDETTPWAMDIILPSKDTRDRMKTFLENKGIGSRIFYPPINSQTPYSQFKKGSFPISESFANRGLWLPSSITLNHQQIKVICTNIKEFFNN